MNPCTMLPVANWQQIKSITARPASCLPKGRSTRLYANQDEIVTDHITRMDATRLAELIANRELSPVEVVQAHLDRIAAVLRTACHSSSTSICERAGTRRNTPTASEANITHCHGQVPRSRSPLSLPLRSGGRCRLRRQDAEANGEAGPKGVPQERHVTRMGARSSSCGLSKTAVPLPRRQPAASASRDRAETDRSARSFHFHRR